MEAVFFEDLGDGLFEESSGVDGKCVVPVRDAFLLIVKLGESTSSDWRFGYRLLRLGYRLLLELSGIFEEVPTSVFFGWRAHGFRLSLSRLAIDFAISWS